VLDSPELPSYLKILDHLHLFSGSQYEKQGAINDGASL
jgi:hypothetical protein